MCKKSTIYYFSFNFKSDIFVTVVYPFIHVSRLRKVSPRYQMLSFICPWYVFHSSSVNYASNRIFDVQYMLHTSRIRHSHQNKSLGMTIAWTRRHKTPKFQPPLQSPTTKEIENNICKYGILWVFL